MTETPLDFILAKRFVMRWKEHQLQLVRGVQLHEHAALQQPGGPNSVTINAGAELRPVRAEIQLLAGVWAHWPEERSGPGGGKHDLRL